MKTEVKIINGEWRVRFTQGSQTFILDTLDVNCSKKIALYYKSLLDKAFKNYENEIYNK